MTVLLPIPAEGVSIGEAARPAGPSGGLHVMVVDDEPAVREVLKGYLTYDGHTVETATDGREGLDRFASDTFDLVLADKAMPKMSGEQLAAAIHMMAPRPVITLTGFGDMMQATGEKPVGVALVLNKPVTPQSASGSCSRVGKT